MLFAFTEQQEDIRRTAHELLAERMPLEAALRHVEGDTEGTEAVWEELVSLGWPGIFVAEEDGGLGLGVLELAILCEQLGEAVAPLPFLPTAAAGLVLRAAGTPEQRARLLRPIAEAGTGAALAGIDGDRPVELRHGRLFGEKVAVAGAHAATTLVVAAGGGFVAVAADDEQIALESTAGLDLTRPLARVTFDGAACEPLEGAAGQDVGWALDAILAAESAGVAQRALDEAVQFAKQRRQFGIPIGAFQGVSHRCAEMLRFVEGARATAYAAAWACDHDANRAPFSAQVARGYALDAAVRVCESAIQVHGGVGFTWEAGLHLRLRRAQANARILASPRDARRGLGESLASGSPLADGVGEQAELLAPSLER